MLKYKARGVRVHQTNKNGYSRGSVRRLSRGEYELHVPFFSFTYTFHSVGAFKKTKDIASYGLESKQKLVDDLNDNKTVHVWVNTDFITRHKRR
jgi:hypothetical protein